MATNKIKIPQWVMDESKMGVEEHWNDSKNNNISVKVINGRVFNDDKYSGEYGTEIFDFEIESANSNANEILDVSSKLSEIDVPLVAMDNSEASEIYTHMANSITPILVDDTYITNLKNVMKSASNYSSMGLDSPEGLESILPYCIAVEELYHSDKVMEEKISIAKELMEYDATQGYTVRSSIATVKNGKREILGGYGYCQFEGTWLEFISVDGVKAIVPLTMIKGESGNYHSENFSDEAALNEFINKAMIYNRDTVKNSLGYSEKFKNAVYGGLTEIKLVNISPEVEKKWVAFYSSNNKGVTIDLGCDGTSSKHEFMVGSITHELGHAFDDLVSQDTDNSINWFTVGYDEWQDIYNQLKSQFDASGGEYPLREYAFTNVKELFAECTAEYFGDSAIKYSMYNPNDLKSININVHGQTITLYEYMHSIYD